MKPRVVYWNNIPAPYIVDRFNAVVRRGNLSFEAWFSGRKHSERSWIVNESDWMFPYRYLPALARGDRRFAFPTKLLSRRPPQLLVSLYADPEFVLGTSLARSRGVRTAFWTEITFDAWIRRRRWKETLKRGLFSRVDGVIVAGPDGRRFARRYGTPEMRIHHVGQSIDVGHFAAGTAMTGSQRQRIRDRFGVKGTVFLCVGRLSRGKGLDVLLDAFGTLGRTSSTPVSLLIVGEGAEASRLKARCRDERLEDVVFADYLPELTQAYGCADVFVFPTLGDPYGLVVDEAMASSLPVISTRSAGEITQRIEDGVNGFLVPAGNSAELLHRMQLLAVDAEARTRMGRESFTRVSGNTPDAWAARFEEAAFRILSMPPARTWGASSTRE
jgi:glycosyltransferase involved in cell wall biosynthesis